MNLLAPLQRWLAKRHCTLGAGAALGRGARIIDTGRNGSKRIQVGANTRVEGELLVFAHGGEIRVGEWCYIGEHTRVWSGASVNIGDRVLIAHGVNIIDNLTHPLEPGARHRHYRQIIEQGHPRQIDLGDRPVVLGDDAWIAASATILRGVTVGRGAVVGAAAVVVEDVPPMTVVAGNPARVIREINEMDT